MSWELVINKGSTVRVPFTAVDENKVPFALTSGTFTITPDGGSPAIVCNHVNGKFTKSAAFVWKGAWNVATAYNVDDVVSFGSGGQARYYRCLVADTGTQPPGSVKWGLFAQFTLLLSAVETGGYPWKTAEYQMGVVFSNGDVNLKYISGFARVD